MQIKKLFLNNLFSKIQDRNTNEVLFCSNRKNNVYIINTNEFDNSKMHFS